MAVVLYKEGKIKICDPFSFRRELENGWSLTKEPKIESEVESKSELKVQSKIEPEAKKQELIERLKARKLKLIKESNKE